MRKLATVLAAFLFIANPARAQLTIEIIGGGANQIPVAVLPFVGETALPQSMTEIIEQDLTRSGRFRTLFVGGVSPLPSEMAHVNFADWKSRLADALVIGQAHRLPDGRFEVRFRLLDVLKQAQIGGIAYTLTAAQVRLTAHKIADFIYEKLTGERGVFSTRIAYVVKQDPAASDRPVSLGRAAALAITGLVSSLVTSFGRLGPGRFQAIPQLSDLNLVLTKGPTP